MNRRKIAAGNWKMNLAFNEAEQLTKEYLKMNIPSDVEVILGVPYVYIHPLHASIKDSKQIKIAAQNCHQESNGAFTGEISPMMLSSMDCPTVIIGHSERREYNHESDELLARKVDSAFAQNLEVIFCCGEPLSVRKAGEQEEYVKEQIQNSLFHLSADTIKSIVIAYEPIWAIGTGETASPQQAQDMHASIRKCIAEKYGIEIANGIPILYGGSVKANNAKEIFAGNDVDGGLVGGASLDAVQFQTIVQSF